VTEAFAANSPYELHGPRPNGRHWLTHDDREVCEVELPERPKFLDRLTSTGRPMGSIGVIQGTYLGVYFGVLCANWKEPERDNCRFCSLGTSVLEGQEGTKKTSQDVLETALAAREELGITFVHLNGGFDDSEAYLDRFRDAITSLRERTGLLIGFQLPPLSDLEQYRTLKEMGVNNVSLCFEIWNPEIFAEVCPGKHRRAGLDRYKEAIRFCTEEVQFDTTNGEMIAGLEPPADSMAAIDWLTGVGAIPTICVFRPVRGTPYEARPAPTTEDMLPVFAHAYRRCMDRGLPIGIAPNIHVSIVLNPEEWRWLLPPAERNRWRGQRLKLAAMRRAFGAWYGLRSRLSPRSMG
ncbi:MAG: radical SAM protein, partial [Planctomycetota bacterium]|jgi:uncharacterized radical SAM superfamily protein